jgi:hypothetical protein
LFPWSGETERNLVKIVTKQKRKRQQVHALADHLTMSVLSALENGNEKADITEQDRKK